MCHDKLIKDRSINLFLDLIIDDQLTLLADTIERCDDIDIDRADKAFDRAMERLRSMLNLIKFVIDLDSWFQLMASLGRSRANSIW